MNTKPVVSHPRRLALYARVSSDKQAQEGTIDSQVSVLRQEITSVGGLLSDELCFLDDGFSGSTLIRPALERLRDQASMGLIDCLHVLAPDRLARKHVHQWLLLEELQANGVEVVFVNRPVGSTPEDQLLLNVQGVVAEYERAKLLERTRRGRLHAAKCGRVNVLTQAPFGYRYRDKQSMGGTAAFEVNETEADIVRRLFAWIGRDGCSLSEATRRLQKLGVRTRHGRDVWNRSTLHHMLTNPAYAGTAIYGKTRQGERRARLRPWRGKSEVPKRPSSTYRTEPSAQIAITVPALIDTELFALVQERLQEHRQRLRKPTASRYLLQGLLVCGGCQYAVCGHRSPGLGTKYVGYYRCLGNDPSRFAGHRLCDNRMHRIEDLDELVWRDVCDLLSEPERLRLEFERRQQPGKGAKDSATEASLRLALAKAKQGQSRLLDAFTAGLVEIDDFQQRMDELKKRQKQISVKLAQTKEQEQQAEQWHLAHSRLQEFADEVHGSLAKADWKTRRRILETIVKRVEMDKERIRIVYKIPASVHYCPTRLSAQR
jgi:site-specific DNA recombinase